MFSQDYAIGVHRHMWRTKQYTTTTELENGNSYTTLQPLIMNFDLHHYGESDSDISVDCALYNYHSISENKGGTLVHLGLIGGIAITRWKGKHRRENRMFLTVRPVKCVLAILLNILSSTTPLL